jgi:antitoxin VapB
MDTAQVVSDSEGQSVRLPEAMHFPGDRVFVKKIGNAVVLMPCSDSWQSLAESLAEFTPDFMAERVQPIQTPRASAFE